MKRLVWLVLVAFCTALAQVQPVAPMQRPAGMSCCNRETARHPCGHEAAREMDHCVACSTCGVAFCSVLPATAVAVADYPAEICQLSWRAEKGRILVYPPLLTPPRLLG